MKWPLPLGDSFTVVHIEGTEYTCYIKRKRSRDITIVCKEVPLDTVKEYYYLKYQAQYDYKLSLYKYAHKKRK